MLLAGKKRKTYSTKGMKSKDESLQYRLLASYSILQFLKGEHTQPLTRPSLQPAREAGILTFILQMRKLSFERRKDSPKVST